MRLTSTYQDCFKIQKKCPKNVAEFNNKIMHTILIYGKYLSR